jgi:uncharacterized protein YbjQ (UPF0145 family)
MQILKNFHEMFGLNLSLKGPILIQYAPTGVTKFRIGKAGGGMGTYFDIVFEGKILPGKDPGEVRKALASVLKKDPSTVETLFSGRPFTLRKQVAGETAEKFKSKFESAGAICVLKPVAGAGEPPAGLHVAPPTPSAAPKKSRLSAGNIILTNVENIPGQTIVEHFGLVAGSTIRAKHIGRDIMASFRNLVGGEIKSYTQLLQESRQEATERMVEQARQLGANAVVNVRYSTSSIAQGAAELYAYGTAVRVE